MGAIALTAENFDNTVLQSKKLVLVDFWAEWCAPCKAMGPTLDQLADEMSDEVVIGKLNVEEHTAFAEKYQIRALPSLLLFRDGNVIAAQSGSQPKAQLRQWLSDNAQSSF